MSQPAAPNLNQISRDDLAQPRRLAALYLQAVKAGFWPNSDYSVVEFFSLAEKALEEDTYGTPGKLFYGLIKHKDTSRISDTQERRSLEKIPSEHRFRLVTQAAQGLKPRASDATEIQYVISGAEDETDLTYFHSVLVQCFFPYGHWPGTAFKIDHGNASLQIEAGTIVNKDKPNSFIQADIPFGGPARIILAYINQQAIHSDVIDLGSSLRDFLGRNKVPVGGKNGAQFRAQVDNIAAARIVLGTWTKDGAHGTEAKIAKRHSFWLEKDERQHSFWRPELELSAEYRELLRERPVPLSMPHILALRKYPRAMDLYCWLSYRLPRINHNRPIKIPWNNLHPIFGSNVNSGVANFRKVFIRDLKRAVQYYPDARVDTSSTSYFTIQRSPYIISPTEAKRQLYA